MKLWMLTEIPGEPGEAAALVWADDPDEARWLLREKTGKGGRVCIEIQPERGLAALIGVSAGELGGDGLAQAIAMAIEEAAISDWDADDGKVIEIYVSQIAPIVERVLREGDR